MKKMVMKAAAALFALTAAITLAQAKEVTLKIGDPAPKLQTGKWVQGEPVKEFQRDKAYIVEFWATWCGPCRASIPHLNDIWQKFKDKDLVVIGQNVWERDESLVAPFVKKMGEKMTYRVALDDKQDNEKGKMAETWMDAAGQNGIPAAFLVDKQGRIAWLGHPMALKESVIEEVLAGKYDVKKAAADYDQQQENQAELMKLSRQLGSNMRSTNWDKADATIAAMAKLLPEDERPQLDGARLEVLLGRGNLEAAAALATKLSDTVKDNPMAQNQLAWQLASHSNLKGAALETAAKIAARANELAGGKDSAILDTFARVTFMQGKQDKAIELEEKAVKLAEGEMKPQLEMTLESYKDGKLPKAD
jgi:thiol-disulfide isomerase/thioredoxin